MGVTAIIELCLAGSAVASYLPPDLIHGLGIIPIAVGAHRLLFRRETNVKPTNLACSMKVLAVAAVSFADCSDNIAVFTPFFAHLNRIEKGMVTFLFLVFIGLWCWFAWYLTHHAGFSKTVRTVGNVIAPWALIALGIIILLW